MGLYFIIHSCKNVLNKLNKTYNINLCSCLSRAYFLLNSMKIIKVIILEVWEDFGCVALL